MEDDKIQKKNSPFVGGDSTLLSGGPSISGIEGRLGSALNSIIVTPL